MAVRLRLPTRRSLTQYPERVSALILIRGYAAGRHHLASDEDKARKEAASTLTGVGQGADLRPDSPPGFRRVRRLFVLLPMTLFLQTA